MIADGIEKEITISQNSTGDSIESNWVLLRVMSKVASKEPPSGIKEIEILPPKITGVSPNTYIRGGGGIDPLIIEGSDFYHTLDVWHWQRVVVLLRYPGNTTTIFETPFDLSLDNYPGVSPSRIECKVPENIAQSIAHQATSLEVQVRLDITTYTEASATNYFSNLVSLTCLGTRATIATLSPNRIDTGVFPPKISIFPPDISMFYGMFDPDCVVSVKPEGGSEQILNPTKCVNCNKPDQMPRIEVDLPSQLATQAQDLEIKVGNPNVSGGKIWSNSLILPVGAKASREELAQFPDTEITNASYFLKSDRYNGYLYGRAPYQVEFRAIKRDQDILGFEYAITEGESMPPEDPANPAYKWLDSQAHNVDFSGEDFYKLEPPELNIDEDEGRWTFWIRAVDVEGRRDPTPAIFPIAIDRVVKFSLIVTKIRVDDDADPPGNPSEVWFHVGFGSLHGLSDGCYGSSLNIPREFESDQLCTHGAGNFKTDPHPVWVMGNADTRSFAAYLEGRNVLHEKYQSREWQLTLWGRECDDGPNYYDEQSLGEIIIPFYVTASSEVETPKGYFLKIDGVKHPFNVGDVVHFMKSSEPKDGAFTVWYRFERID